MAFGDRVKLARQKAGLSLAALAAMIEPRITPQAINKYERGEMMPSSSVLVGLAKALGVSLDFLMSSEVVALDGVEFRKTSAVTEREKALIESEVVDHVERYLAVEDILALGNVQSALDDVEPVRIGTLDEAEEKADALRQTWSIGRDPIPSMTAMLEERGIRVIEIAGPETFSGLTCKVRRQEGKSAIRVVVHRHFNVERNRFTLAHELAHAIISDCAEAKAEMAMNRFAGALLVPAEHLRAEVGTGRTSFGYEELIRLKHMYGVSMWCLLHRLKDVGAVSEEKLKSLYRTPARSWLKSEPEPLAEQGDIAMMEKPKRFETYVYRALAEGLITAVKAAHFLRRPVVDVEAAVSGPR